MKEYPPGVLPNGRAIQIHNLTFRMRKATLKGSVSEVAEVAEDVFQGGFELEDLKLTRSVFDLACHLLVKSGWVPEVKTKRKKS